MEIFNRHEMKMVKGDDFRAKLLSTGEVIEGEVSPGTKGFAIQLTSPINNQRQFYFDYSNTKILFDGTDGYWFIDGHGFCHPDEV